MLFNAPLNTILSLSQFLLHLLKPTVDSILHSFPYWVFFLVKVEIFTSHIHVLLFMIISTCNAHVFWECLGIGNVLGLPLPTHLFLCFSPLLALSLYPSTTFSVSVFVYLCVCLTLFLKPLFCILCKAFSFVSSLFLPSNVSTFL